MRRVLFIQDIGVARDRVLELLGGAGDLEADWSYADGGEAAPSSDVVAVVTVNSPVSPELLDRFPSTRVVSVSFTGYDHVDADYCLSHDIAVYNVPGYSTDSVVELAVGLALALLREIPAGDAAVRGGDWHGGCVGEELAGRTCGILGTGAIGTRLAGVLRALRCEVIGWSRTEHEEFKSLGGRYVEWTDLFVSSDILFVTLALTNDTRGIVGSEELELLGSDSYLVNVARGPVVDSAALLKSMFTGGVRGVALDVYDKEPLPTDDPTRQLPRSVLTPHIAYRTAQALDRKAEITVANVHRGMAADRINRVL